MRNFFISVAVIALSLKFGWDYFNSEKFQQYGDRTKAPWTCRANMYIGGMYTVMSEYDRAYAIFERAAKRCPETAIADEASYRMAVSLADMGRHGEAVSAYESWAEAHPDDPRAKTAIRAAQVLRGNF